MAPISNLKKAHAKINEESTKVPEGEYTLDIAVGIFDSAVEEFKLNEDKVKELKAMEFTRKLDKNIEDNEDIQEEPTLEEIVVAQDEQIKNLTSALAKIATLTGYGNHLKEFSIDKWEPTRKNINKKFNNQ